jgi:hypothetical protein
MTGQIPPYGKNFRRESERYTPDLANTVYVLKRDGSWFIRSDKTSKVWRLYRWHLDHNREMASPTGRPQPSMAKAMALLLAGIEGGFYEAAEQPDSLSSRKHAAKVLAVLGLEQQGISYVLRRAHGHLTASFNIHGDPDQLGYVNYDRDSGIYTIDAD